MTHDRRAESWDWMFSPLPKTQQTFFFDWGRIYQIGKCNMLLEQKSLTPEESFPLCRQLVDLYPDPGEKRRDVIQEIYQTFLEGYELGRKEEYEKSRSRLWIPGSREVS